MSTWGNKEQMVKSIIHLPDEVCRVICQIMAKLTTEEPKRDKFWLIKNRAIFLFHEGLLSGKGFVFINLPFCTYWKRTQKRRWKAPPSFIYTNPILNIKKVSNKDVPSPDLGRSVF
jgi:hypothetical protein